MQGFVKVVKNKAYFKRYQVKFRRRRGEAPCSVVVFLMFEVIFKYLFKRLKCVFPSRGKD